MNSWECFCDISYYNLWAVRRKTDTKWGECFHLNNQEEAIELTSMLNDYERQINELKKEEALHSL